ncbi:MAG: hypothetical protein FWD36_05905 [Treponema sp.]|nr:hypothetical protein [Treponema sp.]
MKKQYLGSILLFFLMILMVSCAGTSKKETAPVAETAIAEPELAEPELEEPVLAEAEPAALPEEPEAEPELEEPVLAEAEPEPELEEPVFAEAEPEPELEEPVLAEAEPAALPEPIAELPQPVAPPPPPPPPAPPPPPPPPLVVAPEPEPEPAALSEEEPVLAVPLPLTIPELPNPTPGFMGRPDERTDVPITFSRVVRATVGQLVEVPFRGTGWTYVGELGAIRGIAYDARRLDPDGQSFIFRTELPGVYVLKFHRQDFIRDFILNDHVQVIVGEPPETAGTGWFNPPIDRGRVIAEPRWPSSLEEARRVDGHLSQTPVPAADSAVVAAPAPAQPPAAGSQPLPSAPPVPPVQEPASPMPAAQEPAAQVPAAQVPLNLTPEEYLKKAKEEFDAGKVAAAISWLDMFCERYPSGSDEAWWLYGQFYEANSPSRNILLSLEYYRRLVQEYPQSHRANDARRRIAFLERFYININ